VNDADREWTNDLIRSEGAESAVEPTYRRRGFRAAMIFRGVRIRATMYVIAMRMNMAVHSQIDRGKRLNDPSRDAGEIQDSEQNQHQADRELHRKADSGRNDQAKNYNRGADDKNCECVADAPQRADNGRVLDASLTADDRGHRDDVVGIGGMAHPEKKTENDDGNGGQHIVIRRPRRTEMAGDPSPAVIQGTSISSIGAGWCRL